MSVRDTSLLLQDRKKHDMLAHYMTDEKTTTCIYDVKGEMEVRSTYRIKTADTLNRGWVTDKQMHNCLGQNYLTELQIYSCVMLKVNAKYI